MDESLNVLSETLKECGRDPIQGFTATVVVTRGLKTLNYTPFVQV